MSTTATGEGGGGLAQKVAENPLWYHAIELPGGVVTPGQFDLRPIVDKLPWPDVTGKRCLDVGTYDGYLAFELDKRGASEVLAADIDDHEYWDWPPRERAQGPEVLAMMAGPEKGVGFRIAKEALGSKAERIPVNIYDLNPEEHGTFDVVVCGSLLLHLRDPIRALQAIRSVCSGVFLSSDHIDVPLTLLQRRKPAYRLWGERVQWWLPNMSGYHHMIRVAGFDIEQTSRAYAIPFGTTHPSHGKVNRKERLQKLVCRGYGVPHAAVLARPAL
ncbi:MAG: methyltransferase domain-containing protein [Thermoleophilaceae bacterium]